MTQLPLRQLFQQAVQHHQSGRLGEAEALYRQILSQQPDHPDATHLLGVIAAQVGRNDVAVELISHAIALKPNAPDAHNNLANALKALGRFDEAIATFQKALALKPDYADASKNLGDTFRETGQLPQAIAAYRHAIAIQQRGGDASSNLGTAVGPGNAPRSTASQPKLAEIHNNLGNALNDNGQVEEAIDAYRRAITLHPAYAMAHNNLGNALRKLSMIDAAIEAYHHALALKPGYPAALNNLANALKDTGEVAQAIDGYRQLLASTTGKFQLDVHSNICYSLYFHPDYDDKTIAAECRRWNDLHAQPLQSAIQPNANDRTENRRLKVGYISPDFRGHAEAFFVAPLLAAHDHQQFEIHCYSSVRRPDEITALMKTSVDAWHDVLTLADEQLAQKIRDDQIDILVDLSMHMAENRLLVFARKPAPVQVTWLAYPGTTGLAAIDYRITDDFMDPSETDLSFYAEKSIRLPGCWVCYDSLSAVPPATPRNLAANPITFGSLNNPCKMNEPLLQLWARLLLAVPNSRLLLLARSTGHREKIQKLFASAGVDPARLDFIGSQIRDDYLRLYDRIDIALDPLPYNGITTTADALWMGVPVVSLTGKTAAGRAGRAMLTLIGLPDLVAPTPEDFLRIAAALAHDAPRLATLRTTLRTRMENCPLMDAKTYTKNLESAYRDMWGHYCQAR